jgi:hypothetical protein
MVKGKGSKVKAGREFERGRSPIFPELPSPAIKTRRLSTMSLAGEGIKR